MPSRQTGTIPTACWGAGMNREGKGQSRRGSAPGWTSKPNRGLPDTLQTPPRGATLSLSHPHAVHGPAGDTGKVSGAVAGAQGRGCRNSCGLKANAQIMRIFGKKAHLYNLNL